MAYLDDIDEYSFLTNIKIEERDLMATIAMLGGYAYKMIPGVNPDGTLDSTRYGMLYRLDQPDAFSVITMTAMHIAYWRNDYLKSVGVPKDWLMKTGRWGPVGTERERFPEYADKIESPLPIDWQDVFNYIQKEKASYRKEHPQEFVDKIIVDEEPELG